MLEHDVTRDIILKTAHLVNWYRNTSGHYVQDGRHITYGVGNPGGSDLIGIRRSDGKFVACEVKATGGKPSQKQLDFIDAVNLCGGIGFWADSANSAIEEICRTRHRPVLF